jgi:hypothetical protein
MVTYSGSTTPAMATNGDVYDIVATTNNAQTWMWAYWDLGADMPIDVVSVLSRPHFINCLSYCEWPHPQGLLPHATRSCPVHDRHGATAPGMPVL